LARLPDIFVSATFYAAAVRLAAPIFFAAVGETFAERAGLVNVGLEGMMLTGAFGGVLGSYVTGSALAGLAVGIACGVLVACLQGVFAIDLAADQVVSGIALNLCALGLTSFLAREIWVAGNVPQVAGFHPVHLPGLGDLPFLGSVLFSQNGLVYLGAVVVVLAWAVLTRTEWGLRLRACGEDPRSCDSLGIPVRRLRWESMVICGALAGLGGVFISLSELFTFSDGMSGGRGFIALAVVIIARWSPMRAILAALLFGGAEALAFRVQAVNASIPYEIMLALPYIVTLLVYAGVVGRTTPPAALGRAYVRE
jgi:general nucleoside transport system permease protein